MIQAAAGFGFVLDVPTPVRLVAGAFDCARLPDITETVPPLTTDNGLAAMARRAGLPSPAEWVRALAGEGVAVAWRTYGGLTRPVDDVPPDYTGWFLERPARLREHDGGVFFRYAGHDRQLVTLDVERWDADDRLWLALCRSVTRMFPDGEFTSGNCRFTADQWSTRLRTRFD